MKNKGALIAMFIFIVVVIFFLFPQGCPQEGEGTAWNSSKLSTETGKDSATIARRP